MVKHLFTVLQTQCSFMKAMMVVHLFNVLQTQGPVIMMVVHSNVNLQKSGPTCGDYLHTVL